MRTAFPNFRSICASGIVSLFVLFEQSPLPFAQKHFHAHDHDAGDKNQNQGRDHESPKPRHSDCAVQSVAQNTHLSSVQLIEVPFLEISLTRIADPKVIASTSFNPSPFSQRAPPTA